MTIGLFQSGYAWRPGARLRHVDATLVGREIDAIGGERVTHDELIALGVGGTGEIAKCFTQDRDEAAQKRWQDEADYLMRSLIPVVVNPRSEEEMSLVQRVWVPVYPQTNNTDDSGTYQRVPLAFEPLPPREKPDKQLEGWSVLMSWRDKYGDDPLYAPVIDAIDALKN